MGIASEFIEPLIRAALRKKRDAKGVYEVNVNDGTLLDYLVRQTDGTSNTLNHHLTSCSKGA